jgi:HEPN domain-containing protein
MDISKVAGWLEYADADLDSAKVLAQAAYNKHNDHACYHCQQAVEKYLKGFLVAMNGQEPKHIHDLDRLCAMCSEYDISFDSLSDECSYLSDFATDARYPFELIATDTAAGKAIRTVEKVRDFAPIAALRKEAAAAIQAEVIAQVETNK